MESTNILPNLRDLPALVRVPLVSQNGIEVHHFETMIQHLETHFDPSIRDNILFFYLTGSKLYGTSTSDSDWDYVCVTKGPTREARKSLACLKNEPSLPSSSKQFVLKESNVYDMDSTLELYHLSTTNIPKELRFDVTFFEMKSWILMAFEQSILPLEAQCLPSEYILYKDESQVPVFEIDPPVFKSTVCLLAGLKFANARPRIEEKNFEKARKLGCLGIRFLQFGIQILECYHSNLGKATITNWHSIKPVYEELFLKTEFDCYEAFEIAFRPTFKALDTHIRSIMVYETLYLDRERYISRWEGLKGSLTKLNENGRINDFKASKIPQPRDHLPMFSEDAYNMYVEMVECGYWYFIEKYSVYPSIKNNLVSLSLSAVTPVYPALLELHGIVIDTTDDNRIVAYGPGKLADLTELVVRRKNETSCKVVSAAGSTTTNTTSNTNASTSTNSNTTTSATPTTNPLQLAMSNFLASTDLQVSEHLDGIGVLMYYYNGEWCIITHGGSIEGKEAIGTRLSEGKGPTKTTIFQRFKIIWDSQKLHYPTETTKSYMFELITNTSRHMTGYKPTEKIVHLGSNQIQFIGGVERGSNTEYVERNTGYVGSSYDEHVGSSRDVGVGINEYSAIAVQTYPEISKTLNALNTVEEKLQYLLNLTEMLNPFQQAGYVIWSKDGENPQIFFKISAKSFNSVRTSIGHANRVLAFNVAAIHFETESLRDVVLYNLNGPFLALWPRWESHLEAVKLELSALAKWMSNIAAVHFTQPNRKALAASLKTVESPTLRNILFEWYSWPKVSALDLLPSFDIKTLRSLLQHHKTSS